MGAGDDVLRGVARTEAVGVGEGDADGLRPQRVTASRSSVTVSRAAVRLGTSMEPRTRSW